MQAKAQHSESLTQMKGSIVTQVEQQFIQKNMIYIRIMMYYMTHSLSLKSHVIIVSDAYKSHQISLRTIYYV